MRSCAIMHVVTLWCQSMQKHYNSYIQSCQSYDAVTVFSKKPAFHLSKYQCNHLISEHIYNYKLQKWIAYCIGIAQPVLWTYVIPEHVLAVVIPWAWGQNLLRV